MDDFGRILYVGHGLADEGDGLRQALSLARTNAADLRVVVIAPSLGDDFPEYRARLDEALRERTDEAIGRARRDLGIGERFGALDVEVLHEAQPGLALVRQVIRGGHDLVVKEVEGAGTGFRALDAQLLRQCPVPLWLCRPIAAPQARVRVGVALDPAPEDRTGPGHALSVRLLTLARALAGACSGTLDVVSCWDDPIERAVRESAFMRMGDAELDAHARRTGATHRAALDELLAAGGGADGPEVRVHHVRARPRDGIPACVADAGIDVLVLGTVARTGIPGFVIGNTAEDVLARLDCSVLAAKPPGFVSSVQPW
jgi:nucleotide-binding universal stress UspA family protein